MIDRDLTTTDSTTQRDFGSRRPWLTYGLILLTGAIFGLQRHWGAATDESPWINLDLGANASALFFSGDWYRVITANLLHANWSHWLNNMLFLWLIGGLVERMVGLRRYAIVVISTGILSQVGSAIWYHQSFATPSPYSVGISGALFGIVGALWSLQRKFGRRLPGSAGFTKWVWIALLGINFVVMPLLELLPHKGESPFRVDNAAHGAGLIAGAVVGWLLCRRQSTPDDRGTNNVLSRLLLVGLVGLVLVAIATVAVPNLTETGRQARHHHIAQQLLALPRPNPALDNELAWANATDPAVDADGLTDAALLAQQAVAIATAAYGPGCAVCRDFQDTWATALYRQGQWAAAAALEAPLTQGRPVEGAWSQWTRFLRATLDHQGLAVVGGIDDVPSIHVTESGWSLSVPALPHGGQLLVEIQRGPHPIADMLVTLAPNPDSQHWDNLTLPSQPSADPALPTLTLLWVNADAVIAATAPPYAIDVEPLDPAVMALP